MSVPVHKFLQKFVIVQKVPVLVGIFLTGYDAGFPQRGRAAFCYKGPAILVGPLARGRTTVSVLRCTNLDQKCENPVRHFPRYIELSPKRSTNVHLNGLQT
jgi:hypothetical protein